MASIAYDTTRGGTMVQLHAADILDSEWIQMVEEVDSKLDAGLARLLIVATDNSAPNASQRRMLKKVIDKFPPNFRLALVTDSATTRGVLTAINWMVPGKLHGRAFSHADIDRAFAFLELGAHEEANARALLERLKEAGVQSTSR